MIKSFDVMLGATVVAITGGVGSDRMVFQTAPEFDDFAFYHEQECCESVEIVDVCGDFADLIGSPIVLAEQIDYAAPQPDAESFTWTFYRFATAKGTVTVRWLGTSNGCYSEGVDFEVVEKIDPTLET